jgi:hypothetical protein
MRTDTCKPVPGDAGAIGAKGVEKRGTYRIIKKMDKRRAGLFSKIL